MKLHTTLAGFLIALPVAALADDTDLKAEFRAEADAQKAALERGEASLPETLLNLAVIRARSALSDTGLSPQDVQAIGAQLRSDFERCRQGATDLDENNEPQSFVYRWEQLGACHAAAYERAGLPEPQPHADKEPPTFAVEPRPATPEELLEEIRTMAR